MWDAEISSSASSRAIWNEPGRVETRAAISPATPMTRAAVTAASRGSPADAAHSAVQSLRSRGTSAADGAAREIENLLADADLFEHYRMSLLET